MQSPHNCIAGCCSESAVLCAAVFSCKRSAARATAAARAAHTPPPPAADLTRTPPPPVPPPVEQLTIQPVKKMSGVVKLPGSKSLSNRILLLAALAEGTTLVRNLLVSGGRRLRCGLHVLEGAMR